MRMQELSYWNSLSRPRTAERFEMLIDAESVTGPIILLSRGLATRT